MQFAIKKEYCPYSCVEIEVVSRIIEFLSTKNVVLKKNKSIFLSSFDMNDLLLVPPSSPIRLCQKVIGQESSTSWSDEVVRYINSLNSDLYGYYKESISMNRIATTTAVIINDILTSRNETPFCYIQSVLRGSEESTELEIAFPNFSFESVLLFHKELVEFVLRDSLKYNVISTHFSWAEAAVAFRYNGMKLGAIGYLNNDLLRINPLYDKDSFCCIMGVPLKSLSLLWKGVDAK